MITGLALALPAGWIIGEISSRYSIPFWAAMGIALPVGFVLPSICSAIGLP